VAYRHVRRSNPLSTTPQKIGRAAALTRYRPAKHPELVAAQQDVAAAQIADYIEKVLKDAPELRDEQRSQLAQLLAPVRESA
jgi:hypothetical protein